MNFVKKIFYYKKKNNNSNIFFKSLLTKNNQKKNRENIVNDIERQQFNLNDANNNLEAKTFIEIFVVVVVQKYTKKKV